MHSPLRNRRPLWYDYPPLGNRRPLWYDYSPLRNRRPLWYDRLSDCTTRSILGRLNDPWQNISPKQRERLEGLRASTFRKFFPHGARAGLEA